jgi:hypothetical protein
MLVSGAQGKVQTLQLQLIHNLQRAILISYYTGYFRPK